MPALILKQDRADERGEAGDMAYVGGGGDNPLTISLSSLPSESNDRSFKANVVLNLVIKPSKSIVLGLVIKISSIKISIRITEV